MLPGFKTYGVQFDLTDSQKIVPMNQWGPLTYNTQISIGLDSNTNKFRTNEIINLLVRIKNVSTNDGFGMIVGLPITFTEGASFLVTSPSGKDLTPAMQHSYRLQGLATWIQPNHVEGFAFHFDEICQYNEIGTYKILVKMQRPSPDRRKLFDVISNPLYVTIIPD